LQHQENPKRDPASAPVEATSAAYWRSMDGAVYEELIREREGFTRGYQQQEAFLTDFLLSEQRRVGHPLQVLEFGCGFGRHARYLAALPEVRYHGYDFSEKMLAPLRESPPPSLRPIEEHTFSGPDVADAVGGRRFDVVFTVSVLIHNPPERVSHLVAGMAQLLQPGGAVCLIENKLVPVSVFENSWHQGCWLHSYPQLLPEGYDLRIGQGLIDTHDVYVLRPKPGPSELFRLRPTNGAQQPLSPADVDAMGMAKFRAWATSVQGILRDAARASQTGTGEIEEKLRAQERRAQRRKRLARLVDELGSMRAAQQAPAPLMSRAHGGLASAVELAPPAILWNEPLDTRWAQRDPRFARTVHVFHQEWHGIRASAGYLPGLKLAITSGRRLTADEHRSAIQGCAEHLAQVVVFHGYSDNADELAFLLRDTFGQSVRLYAAWLGNTAQFHVDPDYQLFLRLLRRREENTLDGVSCVKPDMSLLSDAIYEKALLSVPPRIGDAAIEVRPGLRGDAFIPVPNDWRKNFYTNLLAAQSVERLRKVVVTTSFREMPGDRRARVLQVDRPERAQVFRLMRDSDVVLNASLSECYPMTALESLSVGTPCLTGPLALGALDDHPFQKLCQIRAVDSVRQVKDTIERVLDVREHSPRELAEMMNDYTRRLTAEALHRHCEFLRL
jgi:SAM-dependent methyltransferase